METQKCWLLSGESSILRCLVEHHLVFVKMCVLFVFFFFNQCSLSLSPSFVNSFHFASAVKEEVTNSHSGYRRCWLSLFLCFLFP